ncbi:hypothetical protein J1N35_007298 [Gossypium stocksii]|uniref:Uncharacterized protein n=1 Tax=Gossypium stocksii TaxID=47602 RepID=A0A9D3W8W8_9ROSI|nr:hypothetical protein J1N35_007298 [Gossypium stocksii]
MGTLSRLLEIAARHGVSKEKMSHILNITGFKSETLPVRYLGVPLVSRRLSCADCSVVRVLAYWNRQFLLLKVVLKQVDQLCSRFLWKGSNSSASGARVKWDILCLPKFEGRLGLKKLVGWVASKPCLLLKAPYGLFESKNIF